MNEQEKENNEITYVLFGKEAVLLYKTSANSLLNTTVNYKVGSYTSVKDFVHESQKWDSFIEITQEEYELLKGASKNKKPAKKSLCKRLFG